MKPNSALNGEYRQAYDNDNLRILKAFFNDLNPNICIIWKNNREYEDEFIGIGERVEHYGFGFGATSVVTHHNSYNRTLNEFKIVVLNEDKTKCYTFPFEGLERHDIYSLIHKLLFIPDILKYKPGILEKIKHCFKDVHFNVEGDMK